MILLLFCLLPVPPQDGRTAVPDPAAQKQAQNVIRDLFKDEYAKRSSSDRQALARKLLAQAAESKDDQTVAYVLLREVVDLAGEAGDATTGLQAIDEMSRRFQVERVRLKSNLLLQLAKVAKTEQDVVATAGHFVRLVDEAASTEDFETASKALGAGSSLAKRSKDLALSIRFQAKTKELADLKAKFEKVKKAKETLAGTPDDPAANLALGAYECLTRANWGQGLPLLGKGSDSTLRDLATRDLADPQDPTEQASVADGWWNLSEKESGAVRERLRQRALLWYERASAKVTGLSRSKVDKRVRLLRVENLQRGTWLEFNDPKQLNWPGKAGEPLDLKAPITLNLTTLPSGDFDGLLVRLRFKAGQTGTIIIGYEPDIHSTGLDSESHLLIEGHLSPDGKSWVRDHETTVGDEEEYWFSVFVAAGEYVIGMNGKEYYRLNTTNVKLKGVVFEIARGSVLLDQLRLRRKE